MAKLAGLAATALLVTATSAAGQEVRDSILADPGAHAVEFENEHVRVISAIASAGYESPMHSHPSLAVVQMRTSRTRLTSADGSVAIVNTRPGAVLWFDEPVHAWKLLGGTLDAIGVEIKGLGGAAREESAAAPWPPATGDVPDSTVADPGAHSVVFENEHVRVISVIASAGHESPMHSHPSLAVIQMATGRVRLTTPDGAETYMNVRPGMVLWLDEPVHAWELVNGELDAIGVEIKAASR